MNVTWDNSGFVKQNYYIDILHGTKINNYFYRLCQKHEYIKKKKKAAAHFIQALLYAIIFVAENLKWDVK